MQAIPTQELSRMDDEKLAWAARDGDHLAFAELYRRYQPIFRRYARRRLKDGIPDVVQNMFVAILNGLRGYKGPRFFSWAYRICVNAVNDELRRRRRTREVQIPTPVADGPSHNTPTPEEELIARQLLDRTRGVLMQMPEGQRTVFLLARVQGMSYEEISDLLSIPVGTVKSRMFGAVRTLTANGTIL